MSRQSTLLDADTPVAKELQPIALQTPRDFSLLTTAIEHRVKELKGLAKKNREEKYEKEARVMEADAAALEVNVLPQVRHQHELPLATVEEVRAGIANGLKDIVRAHLVVRNENGKAERNVNSAIEECTDKIAVRVESYVERVVEDAYAAGYAARFSEPQAIAKRALTALYE